MTQKKKNVKIWIIMLILPFVLLFLTLFGQIIANFALTSTTDSSTPYTCGGGMQSSQTIDGLCADEEVSSKSGIERAIDIFSILLGTVSVVGILAYPVWITLLVVAINHNKKIDEALNQQNTPQNQPPQTPIA